MSYLADVKNKAVRGVRPQITQPKPQEMALPEVTLQQALEELQVQCQTVSAIELRVPFDDRPQNTIYNNCQSSQQAKYPPPDDIPREMKHCLEIFREGNLNLRDTDKNIETVNLHKLKVSEALEMVKLTLIAGQLTGALHALEVIVGIGGGDHGHRSIGPRLRRFAKQQQLKVSRKKNKGRFVLTLDDQIRLFRENPAAGGSQGVGSST